MASKRQEQAKFIERLSKRKDKDGQCHFHKAEIEKLLSMYNKYVESISNKKLDRLTFRDILHHMFEMTDDVLMDRIFRTFDKDNDNYINHDEWVMGLSVFLKGGMDERMKYTFNVYDFNGDGYISREEMFQLLKPCLVKPPTEEDPDEGIKELVEITLKKMDFDHDSRLSFSDFEKAIKEEPLMIEVFGPCLPTHEKCMCFLNLIGGDDNVKY